MRARVIGLGQRAAGDDGAGLAVIEALRRAGPPPDVELTEAAEASALIPLLATPARVVVVDAVLASPPGSVIELATSELDARGLASVSSHGLGVAAAIELARLTWPDRISPDIRVVAVTIARPERHGFELSASVAAAVKQAVERVLALVEASPGLPGNGVDR